jgi:hypothetical protein
MKGTVYQNLVFQRNTDQISEIKAKVMKYMRKRKGGVRNEVMEAIIPRWISADLFQWFKILLRPHIYYKGQ